MSSTTLPSMRSPSKHPVPKSLSTRFVFKSSRALNISGLISLPSTASCAFTISRSPAPALLDSLPFFLLTSTDFHSFSSSSFARLFFQHLPSPQLVIACVEWCRAVDSFYFFVLLVSSSSSCLLVSTFLKQINLFPLFLLRLLP